MLACLQPLPTSNSAPPLALFGEGQPALWAVLACAAILPFLPFVGLPLISDDYTQWFFARRYISAAGLPSLVQDVLYRSRTTSLLLTRLLDAAFGLSQAPSLLAGLALHALNTMLLFRLAMDLRLQPATAAATALCFAVYSGHQEAIVWIASQHELLVFAAGACAALCWLRWLDRGGWWGAAATLSYLVALYSKESGVVVLPLLGFLWWVRGPREALRLAPLGLLAAFTFYYAWAIFDASASHQHLNDGTFSPHAAFWITLPASLLRLLWPAGLVALPLIWFGPAPAVRRQAAAALGWIVAALAPYTFLTYQPRVPSRHTYLAAVGLALVLGLGLQSLARMPIPRPKVAAIALCALFAAGNGLNLWARKLPQYKRRAEATERFLRVARQRNEPIEIQQGPFPIWVYQHAAAIALGRPPETVQPATTAPAHSFLYSDSYRP